MMPREGETIRMKRRNSYVERRDYCANILVREVLKFRA